MNNFQDKFKQDGQTVRMLESEKNAIKNRILAMPIPDAAGSFSSRFGKLLSWKFITVSMAGIVLFIGAPLTYAAQKSVPGDFLHPLELRVIEPLQETVQFTENQQVEYSTGRVKERLQELQKVPRTEVAQEDATAIASNLQDHAQEIINTLPEEAPSENDLERLIQLSALLSAHEDVFKEINQDPENIEVLNDDVEKNLHQQVREYTSDHSPAELSQEIQEGVSNTTELIKNDAGEADTIAIQEQLVDAKEASSNGNFGEAFQELVNAKIQALAQEYAEDISQE